MLKERKQDYQCQLEDYLEEQKIYDLFEDMMIQLIKNRPKDPIQYLVQKLSSPEIKRLIIVGPPGSKRKEIALSLTEYLSEDDNFVCISVGDLLNKEISKKSEYGKQIVEAKKTYSYVKDEIVIELVKMHIELLEKDKKSWIIEGFPRTRLQALAFQRMGIIPDKFILLHIKNQETIEKVKKNLKSEEAIIEYKQDQIDQLALSALTEYKIHIKDVKEVCKGSIKEIDGNKDENLLLDEIARILKLNISNGPRKPPRIFLMGPPGCGKTFYAQRISQKYKIIYIKVNQLIKDHMRNNNDQSKSKEMNKMINQSIIYPDEVVLPLVIQRLKQKDCQINGYILDGCPTSEKQLSVLKDNGIVPQLVVELDLQDQLVYAKLEQKRYDPVDGTFYDIFKDQIPKMIQNRLIQLDQHSQPIIKQKLQEYRNFSSLIQSEFRKILIRIDTEDNFERIFLNFCDAIEHTV